MSSSEIRPPISPGEPAPDFALPAVDGTGTVSLADYRGKTPLRGVTPWTPISRQPVFILSPKHLVTIRYVELSTFDAVAGRVRNDETLASSIGVFTALLEAIVDRGADVLEQLGAETDRISRSVFRGDTADRRHPVRSTRVLRETLTTVGAIGERVSQARDVLLGVGRIGSFTNDLAHE